MTFAGFPPRPQATAIPNVFFTDLLPRLADDATAVGVVLYAFNLLARKRGYPRFITRDELAADPGLTSYLLTARAPADAIDRALERAIELGIVLGLRVELEDGSTRAPFFLNAPADRRGMEAVREGRVDIGVNLAPPQEAPARDRANIYALYEQLAGTISPLIAAELAEAEREYPAEWIEAAFREAAAQNARSWRYVSRILERWAAEGPDYAKTEGDPAGADRYLSGKYGRVLRQRLKH